MAYLNGNMNIMRFVTRESEAPRYKGIFPLPIDSVGGAVSEWYLYGNKNGVGEKQIVNGNLPLDFVSDGTNLENYRIFGTDEIGKNMIPSPIAGTKTDNELSVTCDGSGNFTISVSGTPSATRSVTFDIEDFTFPLSTTAGGGGTISLFNASMPRVNIRFLHDDTLIDTWSLATANRQNNSNSGLFGKTINQIEITASTSATALNGNLSPMVTDDGNYPTVFEPYQKGAGERTENGFKLSLKITSETQTKNTDIYIGDSTLLSDDYVDYVSGKIHRGDGTEITIDLPAIETFNGDNTLNSTETLGETTITQGYHVPLDIRSLSDTNEITKAYRADIIETAGATIDVDRQAGTVTINGTTNNAVAEVVFYMSMTEGDYWYSGVPNQEDNSIMAKLMNTHIRPPYEFNKWDGSEPGSDIGYGEEAVVNSSPVGYHLYFAPNHTFNNLVVKPKVQKATITDTAYIYVGNKPLGEGEMVSKESTSPDIDLERGQSVLETTLTNKPEMIVTPDSYDKIKDMLLNTKQYDYNETQSDTITDEVTEVTQ